MRLDCRARVRLRRIVHVRREQRLEIPTLTHDYIYPRATFGASARRMSQPFVQHPPSARDPRHHRADRNVEHRGNLRVGEFLDVPQPDRLPERLRQRVERRLQIGVERRPRQQLLGRLVRARQIDRLLDGLAVDVHRVPAVVPPHVAERVVEDREQPRLQVGPALELLRRAERLQVRVLYQVLRIRRPARQPQRRPVQAVDVRQRLRGKRDPPPVGPRGRRGRRTPDEGRTSVGRP